MRAVRVEDSSDDSDDVLVKMNSEDSESEEELSIMYKMSAYKSSSDEEEEETEIKGRSKVDTEEAVDVRVPYKEESVKRIDSLKACIEKIHNYTKTGDNTSVYGEAKKLHDLYLKASKYFQNGTPNYFVRFLSLFEEYIENQWNAKSELSTVNRKALPSLRGIMRPRFAEFSGEIEKYRAKGEDKDIEDLFHDDVQDQGDKTEDSKRKRRVKKRQEKPAKAVVTSLFEEDEEVTGPRCLGKLTEIVSVKFKQRKILKQTFEQLEELLMVVKSRGFSVALEMKIVISILELVDLFSSVSNLTPMKDAAWNRFITFFDILLDYIEGNPNIELRPSTGSGDEILFDGDMVVHCNVMIMVEHLSTEYKKRLLAVDEFSDQFVERLSEDSQVVRICQRTRDYLKGRAYCADISIILLDLLYYKYSHLVDSDITTNLTATIEEYCYDVFSEEDSYSVLSVRAVLYSLYHHSLHRNWNRAYELYSFSHVAELACSKTMDLTTQSLYNRCLGQMGICAFLLGRFEDSYRCLADIAVHPQIGYLMGYEVSKDVANDGGIMKVPLHMHVNVRLLEYAYLVSALVAHVPFRVLDSKRKRDVHCRHFENVLNTVEKTAIRGPPEDIWEHVVEAAHFLKDGDWRKCFYYVAEAPLIGKMISLVMNPQEFKEILLGRIKRESLRMFMVSYSGVYTTISFEFLTQEFVLSKSIVESVVGNMIVSGLIDGFVRDGFVIHSSRSKPSLLISALVDKLNEQIIDK